MKRIILTLALLLGANTVVIAGDFEDGMAAYNSKAYATALTKLMKVATATGPSRNPSLEEFLDKARPWNPGVSDEALRAYWSETYGPGHEAERIKAQFFLGVMYYQGQGVPQDYAQAMHRFTKAAEAGYADAQSILGTMYVEGLGVTQDYLQAARWLTKAAEAVSYRY